MDNNQQGNIFASLPQMMAAAASTSTQPSSAEIFEQLAGDNAGAVRIERIVSAGHASDDGFWYDQNEHEWVMVLQGSAVLALQGQEDVHLVAGDYLNIPAHTRHRVVSTAKDQLTIWLAVFYPA